MEGYIQDDWPKMPGGSPFDGKDLLSLVRNGNSLFRDVWDVNLLIREVEKNLGVEIIDIPLVSNGSNNYGLHLSTADGPDMIARLARGDVNMPNFNGFPVRVQIAEVKFEAATYQLLSSEAGILVSRLLYYRIPTEHGGPRLKIPRNLAGRRLMIFERASGGNDMWDDLNIEDKSSLLDQAARIRASLYSFNPPINFSTTWLRDRLFEQKPHAFRIPVAPTREFCIHLFGSEIRATMKNVGDMIGWESDHHSVGPRAAAAKKSLLRLIPYILPTGDDQTCLYRLVLEHGDFGIHNMSITMEPNRHPQITSVYDWETGCIVPALLSDPLMAVTIDLITDEDGIPSTTRVPQDADSEDREEYKKWAERYFETLFSEAPDYESVSQAGKYARHIWLALRDWRGDDPEAYFGDLGVWAERTLKELGVD